MNASSPKPRPLWQTYLAILIPMMLTNVLQAASGTIDGIWIGQLLGVDAIAAVSAFFPVLFLLLSVVIGLSNGATVLIGQAWGAGDRDRVRRIAATALAMMLVGGGLIGIAGAFGVSHLMRALGTPVTILPAAIDYARVMMIGCPVIFLLWLVTSMSRGVGDAVSPLWALAIATIVSMIATPILIEGWAGLPRLGVVSAAYSTIGAFAVAIFSLGWRWKHKLPPLAPAMPSLASFDPALARSILRIGIPAAFQMMTMAAAEMALLGIVNKHGAGATAAYGAVNQVMSWVQFPVMSLGMTATILASHMIGAGKPDGTTRVFVTGMRLNVITTGSFVVAAYLLAPHAIRLFITNPATAAEATNYLRIMLWSILLLGWAGVLAGVMRADGTVLIPNCLSIVAIAFIEVPVAYAVDARIGMAGVWVGYAAAFTAMLLLQGVYYMTVWSRRPVRVLTKDCI